MAVEGQICMPLDGADADSSSETMREYNSRRCVICQSRYPPFGFGPPLTRRSVWACSDHRAEVDRRLRPSHSTSAESETSGKPQDNQAG